MANQTRDLEYIAREALGFVPTSGVDGLSQKSREGLQYGLQHKLFRQEDVDAAMVKFREYKMEKPMLTISGTRIIVQHNGRYLVLRYHPSKQQDTVWDMPGGTIKSSENPTTCAQRELEEETGIKTTKLTLLGSQTTPYPCIKKVYYCFFTKIDSPHIRLSSEHTEFRWLTPAKFDQLSQFKDAEIYKRVIKKFKLS